ncbi:MAG: hypothetical protein WCI34_07505 [Actinomycetes bacterium]
MLGWHISLLRQQDSGRLEPATFESKSDTRVAVWQTGLHGLDWLADLAKEDRIVSLGGNGYPIRYTGKANELLPRVGDKPPEALAHWVCGPNDILTDAWAGKTTFDQTELDNCTPEEWLIVEAWDES